MAWETTAVGSVWDGRHYIWAKQCVWEGRQYVWWAGFVWMPGSEAACRRTDIILRQAYGKETIVLGSG